MRQARSSAARAGASSGAASRPRVNASAQVSTETGRGAGPSRRVHEQDELDARCRRHRGQEALGELMAGTDHGLGVRVPQQVDQILGRAGRVGGYRDGAGREDREIGHAPFRPVLGHDQHAVAARDPELAQGSGPAARSPRPHGASSRRVLALRLRPQERAIPTPCHGTLEHRHEVRAEIGRRHRPQCPRRVVQGGSEHDRQRFATGDGCSRAGPGWWKPDRCGLYLEGSEEEDRRWRPTRLAQRGGGRAGPAGLAPAR